MFLQGCEKMGLRRPDCFMTVDLYEAKNLVPVCSYSQKLRHTHCLVRLLIAFLLSSASSLTNNNCTVVGSNKKIQFADSTCTCKYCNHAVGLDCISANCTCCRETDHSMVLDGMEGFSSS